MDLIDVLIVDDEENFLDQAKIFLERENKNINVVTAESVEKGLNLFERRDFDAIVSDYQMPDLTGIDFLEELRKKKSSNIPFILITGKGREEVAMEALNLGADRYLQKSTDPKTLFGLLERSITKELEKITEERYRDLLENNPNPTIILEEDLNIEIVNQQFLKFIEKERNEVEGNDIGSIIGKKGKQKIDEVLKYKRMQRDHTSDMFYATIENADKEEKDVLLSLSTFSSSEKCIVNIFDITDWVINSKLIGEIRDFGFRDDVDFLDELSDKFSKFIDEEEIRNDLKKNCIQELTILLIAYHGKIHGKGIIDELRNKFSLSISAGTMYPILHELEERDIVEKHEGVRSKKYTLNKKEEGLELARKKIKSLFVQYLLLYNMFRGQEEQD